MRRVPFCAGFGCLTTAGTSCPGPVPSLVRRSGSSPEYNISHVGMGMATQLELDSIYACCGTWCV